MALTRLTSANAIPDDSIANVKMANIVQSKNIVINGDMAVNQRNTSVSGITGNSYNTVDRMYLGITGAGTWTQSKDTTVPTGQGFANSLKMDCTTADASLAAADNCLLQTRFEGQNLQYLKKGTSSAESLTVSFWVYATKTGTNIVELYDVDNLRQISQAYTISSSNTWEKKELTFAGDTTGALDNDNASSFILLFGLAAGSNYTSGTLNTSWASATNANRYVGQVNHADSTSNNFYITGIQMEAGDTASEFEFLPYEVNLNRCYRYYFKTQSSQWLYAINSTNNNSRSEVVFKNTMRATPTATVAFSASGTGTGTQNANINHVTVYVNGIGSGDTSLNTGATFDSEL